MVRLAAILLALTSGGCVSVGESAVWQVNVQGGDHLRPWGVEAGRGATGTSLTGFACQRSLQRWQPQCHLRRWGSA
jgi:hypothetical protein